MSRKRKLAATHGCSNVLRGVIPGIFVFYFGSGWHLRSWDCVDDNHSLSKTRERFDDLLIQKMCLNFGAEWNLLSYLEVPSRLVG